MIQQTTMYNVHTGNLFGISSGWAETFYNRAKEICEECDDDYDDANYACNPAFAGAWITVFEKETADKIAACWRQLLPLALQTMSPRWRADYDATETSI